MKSWLLSYTQTFSFVFLLFLTTECLHTLSSAQEHHQEITELESTMRKVKNIKVESASLKQSKFISPLAIHHDSLNQLHSTNNTSTIELKGDAVDAENWNRWKHKILLAEGEHEQRSKRTNEKKAKTNYLHDYTSSSDFLQPHNVFHRTVTRTQRLLSDSLNVSEYLEELSESARKLYDELEATFSNASFQNYTKTKFENKDADTVLKKKADDSQISISANNTTFDSDYSSSGDAGFDGWLRFIGELQEWYEHALVNSSAMANNISTPRLTLSFSSLLSVPSLMYKWVTSYIAQYMRVLPDSFAAYSNILEIAERESRSINSSLRLLQHRLPELEARRQVRLKQEAEEREAEQNIEDDSEEELEQQKEEHFGNNNISNDDDDNNKESININDNNSNNTDKETKSNTIKSNKVITEVESNSPHTKPIYDEEGIKMIKLTIYNNLEKVNHRINAIGLLHNELWHLSRSHVLSVKSEVQTLQGKIQQAIISNDESTTAKRKELKTLSKLRSRLNSWNEQLEEFELRSQVVESSIKERGHQKLQSSLFKLHFADKWNWLLQLLDMPFAALTKHHLFTKGKEMPKIAWLNLSQAEMALALVARYRLGAETNWEFLDRSPSPSWLTVLSGLLSNEFYKIYVVPLIITFCFSVLFVWVLAYAKSCVIHSIAEAIIASRASNAASKSASEKACTNQSAQAVKVTSENTTSVENTTDEQNTCTSDDNAKCDNKLNVEHVNNVNNQENVSANAEQELNQTFNIVTHQQALQKRHWGMRVVKLLTYAQESIPALLFLFLFYMNALEQIYSISTFLSIALPIQRVFNVCVVVAFCLFFSCCSLNLNEYLVDRYTRSTRQLITNDKKYN